jgi:hypothetical protein
MSERLVAAFAGAVQVRREAGAIAWSLNGLERGVAGQALEVLICGAGLPELPATLVDVEIRELTGPAGHTLQIVTSLKRTALPARAVQVHRPAAMAFFGAVPALRATLATRAAWALLLNLLRIPGVPRLLRALRR